MAPNKHQNHIFQRATACLINPFSVAAMALLLLNDHFFRAFWPGWWTGKLGDFAWLFLFPFALVAILAWMFSQQMPHHGGWVSGLAFGLTGGIFSLAKTWAAFHSTTVGVAGWLFGWRVNWRHDPSDLIALISLGGATWLWKKSTG